MFRCQLTGRVSRPREKMHRIVVERRERVYHDESGIEIGRGWEIVRELSVCADALRDHEEGAR